MVPDFRRPILEPPKRNPLPFKPTPNPGGAQVGLLGLMRTARVEGIAGPFTTPFWIHEEMLENGLNYSLVTRMRRARFH